MENNTNDHAVSDHFELTLEEIIQDKQPQAIKIT